MRSRSRIAVLLGLGMLALPRCGCEDALTKAVDRPEDAEPRIALDAGRFEADAHEADALQADAAEADALEPDAAEADAAEADAEELDAGASIADLCNTLPHAALQRSFSFNDPGPCPWGQGDNSPLANAGGWSARTEQIETITDVPPTAIICAAAFEIPQTEMYFDDAMVIALQGVVLMTDVNVGVFDNDGMFYLYDWAELHGTGGSNLYCLESCTLPAMETPGPMSLEISSSIAQAIGTRVTTPGTYEIRVVTIGDNDAGDCTHTPFDFNVTLEYVVP